jgi:hypothetical protein
MDNTLAGTAITSPLWIIFGLMYRDGCNNKDGGKYAFPNDSKLTSAEIQAWYKEHVHTMDLLASQYGLPNLAPIEFEGDECDKNDHPFSEITDFSMADTPSDYINKESTPFSEIYAAFINGGVANYANKERDATLDHINKGFTEASAVSELTLSDDERKAFVDKAMALLSAMGVDAKINDDPSQKLVAIPKKASLLEMTVMAHFTVNQAPSRQFLVTCKDSQHSLADLNTLSALYQGMISKAVDT